MSDTNNERGERPTEYTTMSGSLLEHRLVLSRRSPPTSGFVADNAPERDDRHTGEPAHTLVS